MSNTSIFCVVTCLSPICPGSDFPLNTLDGNELSVMEADCEKIGEICFANNAIEVLMADTPQLRDRLWEARKLIIEALQNLSPERIMDTMDIVVPRTELTRILKAIKEVSEKFSLNIISFGHSGDGNVHVNIIKNMPKDEWEKKHLKAAEEIYRLALSMGGMITGEHGIGLTRKGYLSLAVGDEQVAIMKKIKDAFDPNHILNPGKIL